MLCITNYSQKVRSLRMFNLLNQCVVALKLNLILLRHLFLRKKVISKIKKLYKARALEWGQLILDEKNKISIKHLLMVGGKQFPVVKHWRQDWIYQNTDLYLYDKNDKWSYISLNKKMLKASGHKKFIK